MTIFVSYTTRDSYVDRLTLEMISDVLSNYGSHYIDLLHNESTEKQRHVEEMLSSADLMILINSQSIHKSKWVQWELSEAKRIGIPIITVQASMSRSRTIKNLKYKVASELKS